jgi:hypothetical protein
MSAQQTRQEPEQKKMPQPPGQPPRIRWREVIFWVLMPMAVIIWNMLILWPQVHPEIKIPYSIFLAQVRSGNVSRVEIRRYYNRLFG